MRMTLQGTNGSLRAVAFMTFVYYQSLAEDRQITIQTDEANSFSGQPFFLLTLSNEQVDNMPPSCLP